MHLTKALLFAAALMAASCEDPSEGTGIITGPVTPKPEPPTEELRIPDYDDDYSSIAGWNNHKFNTAYGNDFN